jgi:hypothetical protein
MFFKAMYQFPVTARPGGTSLRPKDPEQCGSCGSSYHKPEREVGMYRYFPCDPVDDRSRILSRLLANQEICYAGGSDSSQQVPQEGAVHHQGPNKQADGDPRYQLRVCRGQHGVSPIHRCLDSVAASLCCTASISGDRDFSATPLLA